MEFYAKDVIMGRITIKEVAEIAGVFNSGIPDWHIYAHWKHVINQMTQNDVKCPWSCPYHEGDPVLFN
jgi:hypothetical protein